MNRPTICTIIAKNYLAYARTLCDSYLEHHPEGRCFVLVIDDWEGLIDPAREAFEIVSLSALKLPQPRAHFTFKYDITELSTALKPFFLEYLLEAHALPNLLYLDPDILVTARLDALFDRLDAASVYDFVLTPHLDQDYPEDGRLPNDRHIFNSGIFNLGFFGLRASPNSTAFLRWWQQKLTNHCLIAHARGYFVDQRYLDLAITLFPGFFIEKDVGYNTAYWNLHSRRLGRDAAGRWLCNGGPLYFYHFSNYKDSRPDMISGFLNRYSLRDRADLQPLFADYRRRILANGHEQTRRWPYTFGTLRGGRAIPSTIRAFYRQLTDGRGKTPAADPFASRGLAHAALLVSAYQRSDKGLRDAVRSIVRKRVAK